jgi:hypothetical protein
MLRKVVNKGIADGILISETLGDTEDNGKQGHDGKQGVEGQSRGLGLEIVVKETVHSKDEGLDDSDENMPDAGNFVFRDPPNIIGNKTDDTGKGISRAMPVHKRFLKGICVGDGVGIIETVAYAVGETEGEDVVTVLSTEGIAQVDRTVAIILVPVDAGEIGREGNKPMMGSKADAVKDSIVLPMDEVVGHPTIEPPHSLEAEGGMGIGKKIPSKSEICPIGSSISEPCVDDSAARSRLEADIKHDVRKILFLIKELVRAGEYHISGVRDRAGEAVGMAFVTHCGSHVVGFLENKKEFDGSFTFDNGIKEAEEIILCLISRIMMIFSPKLNENLCSCQAGPQFGQGKGIRSKITGRINEVLHILSPILSKEGGQCQQKEGDEKN